MFSPQMWKMTVKMRIKREIEIERLNELSLYWNERQINTISHKQTSIMRIHGINSEISGLGLSHFVKKELCVYLLLFF